MPALQHRWQEGSHGAEHRAAIEIEGKGPLVLGRLQDGSLMNEPGTVEENVYRPGLTSRTLNVGGVQDVQYRGPNGIGGKVAQLCLRYVGGYHMRTGFRESESRGPSDSLAGSSYESGLPGK
jgi:hypothetical protein